MQKGRTSGPSFFDPFHGDGRHLRPGYPPLRQGRVKTEDDRYSLVSGKTLQPRRDRITFFIRLPSVLGISWALAHEMPNTL